MTDKTNVPTLFEWAGGADAIEQLVDSFYDLTLKDDLLRPFFESMSPEHRHYVALWIGEVFGGPDEYSKVRGAHEGHPFMIRKHLVLPIEEKHRARWMQLMLQAADDVDMPRDPEFRSAFVAYFEWGTRMNDVFHEGTPVPESAPVPKWGWGERKPYIAK